MNWFFRNLPIYAFYAIAGLIISCFAYIKNRKALPSLLFGMLVVFVSSEFWEIPRFAQAYLHILSWQPELLNHIIIGIMAIFLVGISGFHLSKTYAAILVGDLVFNTVVFSLQFPFRDWILRSLSLICLSYMFVSEYWKNGT